MFRTFQAQHTYTYTYTYTIIKKLLSVIWQIISGHDSRSLILHVILQSDLHFNGLLYVNFLFLVLRAIIYYYYAVNFSYIIVEMKKHIVIFFSW